MRLCLYQPEIPQNTGTMLRMAACMGFAVDIIEPCGFGISDRRLKRSGMDYMDLVDLKFHLSWEDYLKFAGKYRLILLDASAKTSYVNFAFQKNDILVMGQESIGVPDALKNTIFNQILIPMVPQARSLNVAISAAMVMGEAYRQNNLFPVI